MKRALGISVIDQALVSACNFALNLYLIKSWAPEQFGMFAVLSAGSIFATMLQNALINTPLSVHLPVAANSSARALLRRTFGSANLILTVCVFGVSWALVALLGGYTDPLLALCAALYVAAQFLREYFRALMAAQGALAELLMVDLAYVVLAIGGIAGVHAAYPSYATTVTPLLALMTAAAVLSLGRRLRPALPPSWRALPREMCTVYGEQKHEIRWSLFGVVTTDIQNRGYIFIAAAVFGPVVVAQLQAGRIFFGPLNLLTGAWARVARPRLAKLLAQHDAAAFKAILRWAVCASILLNIAFLLALWLCWPLLSDVVFGDRYRDMGSMITAWGVANVLFQLRSSLATGVQALHRFRDLSMATLWGAAVSVVLLGATCALQQPTGLLASVLGGECMALAVVITILRSNGPTSVSARTPGEACARASS